MSTLIKLNLFRCSYISVHNKLKCAATFVLVELRWRPLKLNYLSFPCFASEVRSCVSVGIKEQGEKKNHPQGTGGRKMPGLQGESDVAAPGSPVKKSKLSLKFFQKKETKRALDFSESQTEEGKTCEAEEPEAR